MSGECKVECSPQCVDIRTGIGSTTAGVLFWWSVARRTLMANKEERAYSICCSLRVSHINQDSCARGRDTDVVGFDVTVDYNWLLFVQKHDRITNSQYPGDNLPNGDDFVVLAGHADKVC